MLGWAVNQIIGWKVAAGLVATLLLTAGVGLGTFKYQSNQINQLNQQIGRSEAVVATHLQTIENKDRALDELLKLNKDCTDKRAAAADRAVEAANEQLKITAQIKTKTVERVNEIKDARPEAAVCAVPVPPRVVRLLVEAASAANRGADRQ